MGCHRIESMPELIPIEYVDLLALKTPHRYILLHIVCLLRPRGAFFQLSQKLVHHNIFVERDLAMGTYRVPPPSSEGVHGFGNPPNNGYDRERSTRRSHVRDIESHHCTSCGIIFHGPSSKFPATRFVSLVSPYSFHLLIVPCIII